MTDIIFAYQQGETNWLNPHWRKAKMSEIIKDKIMIIEKECAKNTDEQKAYRAGMGVSAYKYFRKKFGLERKKK